MRVGDNELRIVATPAKHGPTASPKVRQVIGFAMHGPGLPCIFVSGDTVWIDEFSHLRDDLDAARVPAIDVALIHCAAILGADPTVGPRVVWLEPGRPWELPGRAMKT